ncbi:hypothetical protein FOCC_FOCC006390 [Frankliniella occidentalis]|nr:hypothetical protein FOCC_FOCC006390 [Frankliniella occidentalis]
MESLQFQQVSPTFSREEVVGGLNFEFRDSRASKSDTHLNSDLTFPTARLVIMQTNNLGNVNLWQEDSSTPRSSTGITSIFSPRSRDYFPADVLPASRAPHGAPGRGRRILPLITLMCMSPANATKQEGSSLPTWLKRL